MHLRKTASLVVLLVLPAAIACSGGKSEAEKARTAAIQAKAACDVFVGFHPPDGSDDQSKVAATKATYDAFLRSANLASKAADQDERWKALVSASERLAAAYDVLAKGTEGQAEVNKASIFNAVKEARAARPLFLKECAKADPKNFSPLTGSPSPTPTGAKNA